jgi:hypothetical protein
MRHQQAVCDKIRGMKAAYASVLIGAVGILASGCGDSNPAGPSSPTPTTPPLSFLELYPPRTVAAVGEPIEVTVRARDQAGADLTGVVPAYSSTNPGIVSVDAAGRMHATGPGVATVRASAGGQTAEIVVHVGPATYDVAAQGPPQLLTANYIDLSKMQQISRFRSAIGHSYTNDTGDETCRSMKHYYQPHPSVDWTSVDIHAPVTGSILTVATDGRGFRIQIRARDLPILYVQLFHVSPDPGIVRGAWVEAGQHVGRHASPLTMSDIATSVGPKEGGTLLSYFDTMTDAVFAEYQARGVPSRQAAIITRAERDADPVQCVGESQFTTQGRLPNWLVLN